MHGDLEKAREAVIEAATFYIEAPERPEVFILLARLERAVKALRAIERQSRPSDGGRMNEDSIGGENV